ncbi:ABC transporter permease [Streptomyces violarus]|uniref:Peptide/nickel transport system permease protein n=1 Tax=Streptomyces violarus TaxID=67380 RepID=A0A7W5F3B9_9ACTN|nr:MULTISPECIES: ABC transporter permease [Streptomyces]MBB3078510.1 peptide/nickel transport system permease protein [Streptomyces violarus]WRU03052.1 ABC transporter permease [Streptomyces sp. CGMCC 4.1772]GHD05562.1 ABC transporter permease [Streptomyces violarus]
MFRYLIRRLLAAAVIMLVITTITFFIFFALPSDPALLACGKTCSPSRLAEIKHSLGLDQGYLTQYWEFLKGLVAGRDFGDQSVRIHCGAPCLGVSFQTDTPVLTTLLQDFPADLSLGLGAAVAFLILGVGLGTVAAVRRGRAADKAAVGLALFGVSVQIYFIGLLLLYLFVDKFQILPTSGYTPITEDPAGWFQGLLLPWTTLVIVYLAMYTRLSRSSMLEVFAEDYMRTARAKGLPAATVVLKHGLRAAITPIITIFGMDVGSLIGGSAVITESVFGINGIGKLAVDSVQNSDLPVILGTTLFAATFVVLANVVVDLVYGLVDPRVRLT